MAYTERAGVLVALVDEFRTATFAHSGPLADDMARTLTPLEASAAVDARGRTLTPQEARAAQDKERMAFADQLSNYLPKRQARLDELIAAMDGVWLGGYDAAPRWQAVATGLASDITSTLGQILAGISDPSPDASSYAYRLCDEERSFAQSLDRVGADGAAVTWNTMRALHAELMGMVTTLRASWAALTSEANEIDRDAESTCTSLVSALKDWTSATASRWTSATAALSKTADLAALAVDSDDLATVERKALDILAAAERALEDLSSVTAATRAMTDAVQTRTNDLQVIQSGQEAGGLLYLFGDARQKTAEFVKSPSSIRAQETHNKNKDRMSSWASGLSPNGMSRDAGEVVSRLVAQTDLIRTAVEDLYREFENEHDGVFFNSLRPGVANDLTKTTNWETRRRGVADVGVPAALVAMAADLARNFDANLDTAVGSLVDALNKRPQTAERDRLISSLKSRQDSLAGTQRTRQSDLTSVLQTATSLMSSAQMNNVLGRADIARRLAAL